jgi:CRP-like cAMP-binding protein
MFTSLVAGDEDVVSLGEMTILASEKVDTPLADFRVENHLFSEHPVQEEILPNIYLTKAPDGTLFQTNVLTLSIKFHMLHGLQYLPSYIIVNERMFDHISGGSYGNFEFLMYLNFFMKQFILKRDMSPEEKRTHIICTEGVKKRLEVIFKESYNGPTMKQLIEAGMNKECAKDLISETDYFAKAVIDKATGKPADINSFLEFHVFNPETKEAILPNGHVVKMLDAGEGSYAFAYNGVTYDTLEKTARYKDPMLIPIFNKHMVQPQDFATTIVGSGNGFTTDQETTSFIHWQNGKATLIDGPEFIFHRLARLCVDTRDIIRIGLSHCHADHLSFLYWYLIDSFKKGRNSEIWTTKPIYESAIRVMNAVTLISQKRLKEIMPLHELVPGFRYDLDEGGWLEIDYSFHTIPALKIKFGNTLWPDAQSGKKIIPQEKIITYSGDHLFNPDKTAELVAQGIMSPGRKDAADDFVLDGDQIFYEMGGMDPHTDPNKLREKVTPEQFARIIGYHLNIKKAQEGTRVAEEGMTIGFKVDREVSQQSRVLIMLEHSPWFKESSLEIKLKIASIATEVPFQQDERIVTQGEKGKSIFIVEEGYLDVYLKSGVGGLGGSVARFHKGATFGESALVNMPRKTSIRALTNGALFQIDVDLLRKIIPESIINKIIKAQVVIRPLFDNHKIFGQLSWEDRQWIASNAEERKYSKGMTIVEINSETSGGMYIIKEGKVSVMIPAEDVQKSLKELKEIGPMDIFGERSVLLHQKTNASLNAKTDLMVYVLSPELVYELAARSPAFALYCTRRIQRQDRENDDFRDNILDEE